MMKAIRITKDNKVKLEAQYDLNDGYLELSSGMYLIAGDGNGQIEGVVKPSTLSDRYYRTGKQLANDWFELVPKDTVQVTPEFSDA